MVFTIEKKGDVCPQLVNHVASWFIRGGIDFKCHHGVMDR